MTPELLRAATGCTAVNAAIYAPLLVDAWARYDISTPARQAAFLAQVAHESGAFRWTREIWRPTPVQQRYEGRADLGNDQPGDGLRFCGRGLVQTTGRRNYRHLTRRLRVRLGEDAPDFEASPELLEQPKWAALSAADYWDMRGLNALADAGQFVHIGRAINRGNPDSTLAANGEADRLSRWARAKGALTAPKVNTSTGPEQKTPDFEHVKEVTMPIPAIVAALLPSLIEQIPKLGKLFGSGSQVAERNVALATTALEIAQDAVGATNAQDAVEKMQSDPQARATAIKAIEERWFELAEAGGDGIAGARKADAAAAGGNGGFRDLFRSPSFVIGVFGLLPLVYLIVLSLIGVLGNAEWSQEVRASIAGLIVGTIVGGLVGYYYGQTTSRNRTPAVESS